MKKLFKIFFLVFLFLFLILFSSCSKKVDCSVYDSKYKKFGYDENLKKCVVVDEIQKDICGNGIIEKGETYCNCPKDVSKDLPIEKGGCSGSKGEFLKYACNEEEKVCELLITDKVSEETKVFQFRNGGDYLADLEVRFSKPFMIDRNYINVNFKLISLLDEEGVKVKNFKIESAKIIASEGYGLGNLDLNKELNKEGDKVSFKIKLDKFKLDTFDKEFRSVKLKLIIKYNKLRFNDEGKVINSKTEKVIDQPSEVIKSRMKLIDPNNKNENLENSGSEWENY